MISSCGSSVDACNVTGTIFGTHLLLYHAVFYIRHVTYTTPPTLQRRIRSADAIFVLYNLHPYSHSLSFIYAICDYTSSEATYDRNISVYAVRAENYQLTLPKLPGASLGPTQHLENSPSFICNMWLCPCTFTLKVVTLSTRRWIV